MSQNFIVRVTHRHFIFKTFGGEVGGFGGEASPLHPPVDETLPSYNGVHGLSKQSSWSGFHRTTIYNDNVGVVAFE